MDLTIHPEQPGDADAIDCVNSTAFGSMDEANIVRLMRMYHPGFDPRLSLCAWDGDLMVGHALFSPARVRLLDRTIDALALGPIAVRPERQGEGIGADLIRHGHDLGRADAFELCLLNGHPSYYPSHGYVACFGFAKLTIDRDALPVASTSLRVMPVREDDVPWLARRAAAEWASVDFAWLWGETLSEWAFPGANGRMWWTLDGRRAAYTFGIGADKLTLLLADDPALAREVIATVRPETLDHHPSGWLAGALADQEWAEASARSSTAAMACELRPGVLTECLAAQEAGRPPGFCMFPLPFLVC